jgi:hypothetical protein
LARDDTLLKNSEAGADELLRWRACRRCLSWFDISRKLERFQNIGVSSDRNHLIYWARGVLSVLNFLGEKPFEGFRRLHTTDPGKRAPGSRVFWNGAGVRVFTWPASAEIEFDRPIFFAGKPKKDFQDATK